MASAAFKNVKICGIKTVVPQQFIDIDDEEKYFENNPRKLARAKKMIGFGRRYVADEKTTVTDMAVDAAERLMAEMGIARSDIDLLIFVNQKPDFPAPNDACVAHGKLDLPKSCFALDINSGCTGYVQALLTAHALLSSGTFHQCLLLAGDLCAATKNQTDRKVAPIFGDAASATILKHTATNIKSYFVMGTDGKGFDKIIYPCGGTYLPLDKDILELTVYDKQGFFWNAQQCILKGEDVFKFTMDVAPQLIKDTMTAAGWSTRDVDLFAIHQANKQIVENIVAKAGIPPEKTPIDVFSKYANNSTNSVVTVLCDQVHKKALGKTILCTFGIGLSWGGAALDLSDAYNGGISTYVPAGKHLAQQEKIDYWIQYFKGEK